jgi:hypothetical protein
MASRYGGDGLVLGNVREEADALTEEREIARLLAAGCDPSLAR